MIDLNSSKSELYNFAEPFFKRTDLVPDWCFLPYGTNVNTDVAENEQGEEVLIDVDRELEFFLLSCRT